MSLDKMQSENNEDNLRFNLVVMAGGIGSRLWPLSRSAYPKQYQKLIADGSDRTMLQKTFLRLSADSIGVSQVICNSEHRFLASEQCRTANINTEIVLEPIGRNTAPAVIVAALRLIALENDDPMLILSADHAINDKVKFRDALINAKNLANSGRIVSLGIKPTFASTGYGYIRGGRKLGSGMEIAEFVEKPDIKTAHKYLKTGNYFWNSGIFVVKPSTLIKEAETYCSTLLNNCKLSVSAITKDLDFVRLPEPEFSQCENISLDYAIMEYTTNGAVVPTSCGWSDLGDLLALWQVNKRDDNGNVILGDSFVHKSEDSFVIADSRLVVLSGVKDIAVVETKDTVLVTSLKNSQLVKDVVSQLKGRDEITHHREVYRPWGSYDSVDLGLNYQVKRISVKPGARLSLQRHKFRAEHWVVVEGTAKVHIDGIDRLVKENESIYIPLGAVHSLANETQDPLHLVEVQSGSYLGEDDIERLEDIYGRS